MPRVRTLQSKRPPEGFDLIEPALEELERNMRDAVNEPHEGKRKCESTWKVTKIHWQRSRYIYELYYKKKQISRELYEWCLDEKYADKNLIAKWKKPGFEFLCSLQAIDKNSTAFGTTSICRVPLHKRQPNAPCTPAVTTGCISCASTEASRMGGPIWWDVPRPADLVAWAKAGCPTESKPAKKRKIEETNQDEDAALARAMALAQEVAAPSDPNKYLKRDTTDASSKEADAEKVAPTTTEDDDGSEGEA